jgi:hypothetical protein
MYICDFKSFESAMKTIEKNCRCSRLTTALIFHKNPISRAVYNARISLWLDIRQNGKFRFFAAFSSSEPSPTTTYVLFLPNLVMTRSKHDSLPKSLYK